MSAAEELHEEKSKFLVKSRFKPERLDRGGPYFVDMTLAKPIGQGDFFAGLKLVGFERVIVLQAGEKGTNPVFLAGLRKNIRLVDTPLITWDYVDKVRVDLFAAVPPLDKLVTEPFELECGGSYEMRFVARVKKTPKLADVKKALKDMGFGKQVDVTRVDAGREEILANVSAEKTNMQLSVWYARSRWRGPKTVITQEDPFVFLEMKRI